MACLEKFSGEKYLSLKRTQQHGLFFAKVHVTKPLNLWNNVLWTDQTKVEKSGYSAQFHVWQKAHISYQNKTDILTMEHGGG